VYVYQLRKLDKGVTEVTVKRATRKLTLATKSDFGWATGTMLNRMTKFRKYQEVYDSKLRIQYHKTSRLNTDLNGTATCAVAGSQNTE
jgi:hypothetical protein